VPLVPILSQINPFSAFHILRFILVLSSYLCLVLPRVHTIKVFPPEPGNIYFLTIHATYLAHHILSDLTNITTLEGNTTQEALPPLQ
jgi:hypothetical protein